MKDICPARILKSCGSSSSLHTRINFPIGVILASFLAASLAFPSFSASTRMLRNL
jgi:hypothetical protein